MIRQQGIILVPVLPPERIQEKVGQLARDISRDLEGTVPLLVCVLKGAFVFMADLVRGMTIPVEVDFVRLSSYGNGMESSGSISILGVTETRIEGRDIVLVEDIIDTGLTMRRLREQIQAAGPASVRTCVLVRKTSRAAAVQPVDYLGFDAPEGFLVGYGLDYAERYRELPGLFRISRPCSRADEKRGPTD